MEKLILVDESDGPRQGAHCTDSGKDDSDSCEDTESLNEHSEPEDNTKEKQIQIWHPHVKRYYYYVNKQRFRIGEKAYGKKLHSRTRNKANSGSKKDCKQRKIKSQISMKTDTW